MSFTCTRYDDSIPCDASPSYFYLNKRNGDPKAYFLTDDDIFKRSHSSSSSSQLPSSSTSSPYNHHNHYNNYQQQQQQQPQTTSTSLAPTPIITKSTLPPSSSSSYPQSTLTTTTLMFNEPSLSSNRIPHHHHNNNHHRTRKPIQMNDDNDDGDYHHEDNHYVNQPNDRSRRPKQQLDRNEHRNRLISSVIDQYSNDDDDNNDLINLNHHDDDIYRTINNNEKNSSLILEHSTTLKNNHRQPHLHRAPSPYELETPKTYLSTGGGGGGSNGGGDGRSSSSSTITTPVIIHKYPKYESTTNKLMNTYVPMDYNINRQINSKSLSSTSTLDKKLFNYGPLRQTTTVSSSYDGNISIDNLKPTTATYTTKLDTDNLSSYEIMKKYSSPKNAVDTSTTDRPLIDYGNISPTPISAHKGSSSTFTPATFSQLYIENQKASKLEPIPASYVRLVEQRQQQIQQQQQRNKPTTLKAFNHINEQLISLTPMNNKTEQYTKIGSNHHHNHNHGSVLSSPLSSSTLSKYEQLIAQSLTQNNNGHSTQISPNHYVTVASPIRIIEPTREISRSLINSNGKDQTLSSSTTIIDDNVDNNQQQPVKISFVNDNNNSKGNLKNHRLLSSTIANEQNNEQNTKIADYGTTNYKVVKQIKGKNLLIDPSLENDPERDSIIAQVLEMLNKYN